MMADNFVLDYYRVSTLLTPTSKTVFATEEQLHSWRPNPFETFEKPFLRIWDQCSGSQPDAMNYMMSRAPHHHLDTFEARKNSLTSHLQHNEWTPTPYVSFTTLAAAVEDLANMRTYKGNRGVQTLTVVDPNTRLRDGLPILDVAAEMDHYKIPDPYGKSNQYYKDHYVCLWQVTKREIVGHWLWNDLVARRDWYQEIIIPAFRQFNRKTVPKSPVDETCDLSTVMNKLCRRFLM